MVAPSGESGVRPFPYGAVVILALVLTVNAYTLTNLFPYVGIMVKQLLGLSTINEAGFYAGYVASAFTFGRFLSGYAWGHVSDMIGRKSVVMVALTSIAVLSVVFGLSTSFAMAVTSRFILGLLNGTMPAVRAMTREMCGTEHVVVGMAYISGSKGVGLVLGTGIGGILAQPAVYFPSAFSGTGLFGKYPFLLPNLFGACGAVVALLLVFFGLPETKNFNKPLTTREQNGAAMEEPSSEGTTLNGTVVNLPKMKGRGSLAYQSVDDAGDASWEEEERHQQRNGGALDGIEMTTTIQQTANSGANETSQGQAHTKGTDGFDVLEPTERGGGNGHQQCNALIASSGRGLSEFPSPQGPPADEKDTGGLCGPGGLLATPKLMMILPIVLAVELVGIGFEEAYPLWALSTPDVGGLEWNTMKIGQVLSVTGILLAVFTLGVVPHVIKHVGIVNWQRAGCLLAIPVFISVPNAKFLSWNEHSLFAASVFSNLLAIVCVGSIRLALTVASTSMVPPHQRGRLGGVFMTVESIGRFLGPAGFATTFAWSISTAISWVDYNFVFVGSSVIFAFISAVGWRTLTLETLMKPAEKWEGETSGNSSQASTHGNDLENEVAPAPVRFGAVEKEGGQYAECMSPDESKDAAFV